MIITWDSKSANRIYRGLGHYQHLSPSLSPRHRVQQPSQAPALRIRRFRGSGRFTTTIPRATDFRYQHLSSRHVRNGPWPQGTSTWHPFHAQPCAQPVGMQEIKHKEQASLWAQSPLENSWEGFRALPYPTPVILSSLRCIVSLDSISFHSVCITLRHPRGTALQQIFDWIVNRISVLDTSHF
jgi:hypothetical protein